MMTTPSGAPAPKHKPGTFIVLSKDKVALPMDGRGASHDGGRLSEFQKWVMVALDTLSHGGRKPCFATNLEIADAIGLVGRDVARRGRVKIALNGRAYRKARLDPETGKWVRDGELVTIPGLLSIGFLEARQASPKAPRELVLTSRWIQCARFPVFSGEPTQAGPSPVAVAPIPEAVASVEAPAPVATKAAEPMAPAAIAEPGPIVTPVEPPAADALAEVLGEHFLHRSRKDQASRFVQVMLSRTMILSLVEGGKIKATPGSGADPLSHQETAVLVGLKPELVKLLKARAEKSNPPPKAGEPPGGERRALRVENPAEIRAMIGKLSRKSETDRFECQELARRIVNDPGFRCNDSDPATSEETFFGLALAVKQGNLPLVVMLDAFEAACGPKVRNRGARFIDEVKRIKAGLLKKSGPEGGNAP